MSNTISHLLSTLNPEQRSAVEKIDGPVLVLAGPGTGKTHVLTTRIAHILDQTDVQPHNILALTYSDAGAKTMQTRLIELIGLPAYDVTISTFHAFSSDLIMKHQSDYTKLTGYTQITDLEQSEILESILKELKVTKILYKGKISDSISSIINLISSLKQEHQTPLLLKKFLKDEREVLPDQPAKDTKKARTDLNRARKQLDKLEEFIQVFASYQTALQEKKRYDYADMVLFALDLLENNPDVLLELQEQYQYVLVDEFQDTNTSQYELLDKLTSYWEEKANLFVVGDPDQTIYRFQGASLENIHRFQARFPQAHIVQLQENYRSTQPILDAAESIIKLNTDHVRKEALSANSTESGHTIEVTTHASTLYEQIWIAQQVKELIESEESPNEIAILTKQRKEVETLAEIFSRMEIPFLLDKGVDAVSHPSMLQLRRFLSAISSMTLEKPEDDQLFTVMSYPWLNLDFTDVLTLFRYCKDARTSFGSYLLGDS